MPTDALLQISVENLLELRERNPTSLQPYVTVTVRGGKLKTSVGRPIRDGFHFGEMFQTPVPVGGGPVTITIKAKTKVPLWLRNRQIGTAAVTIRDVSRMQITRETLTLQDKEGIARGTVTLSMTVRPMTGSEASVHSTDHVSESGSKRPHPILQGLHGLQWPATPSSAASSNFGRSNTGSTGTMVSSQQGSQSGVYGQDRTSNTPLFPFTNAQAPHRPPPSAAAHPGNYPIAPKSLPSVYSGSSAPVSPMSGRYSDFPATPPSRHSTAPSTFYPTFDNNFVD